MTHILLVHGAWHGAWCWDRLIEPLRAEGFTPHTIDLPGHGAKAAETQTLAAYAEAVAARLRDLPGPAVLLGHSMGGQVISAAAELAPDRITTLIYLCAFMNRTGESIFARAAGDEVSLLGTLLQPIEDGRLIVADEGIKPAFYADCSDADIAFAKARFVPQSPEPFAAELAVTDANYGRLRRAYIVCENDKAIGAPKQRELIAATPVASEITLATSHSPFFSAPAELAAAIRASLDTAP
ncbi:MAG: alpha/beta fold hydrolase [Micropepsaceae bacterium]